MNKSIIATLLTLMTAISGVTYMAMNNHENKSLRTATNPIQSAWTEWQAKYGKTYSKTEGPLAYAAFAGNYKFVEDFNKKGRKFTVGLNQFADLTHEQFSALRRGQLVRNNKPKNIKVLDVKVPSSVDWVTKGAVTGIKNQGQCGSCWAFSTTGSLEGLNFINTGKLLSFSEQQLVDCSTSYGNNGCNGGLMDYGFEYAAAEGMEQESTYPYTAEDGTCAYKAASATKVNTGHTDVTANSASQLMAAVAQQPVSIAIEADQSSFQLYTSGIYDDSGCGTSLDHGVLAVGYGVSGSTKYWIVKNSWGTSWGMNGYIEIENDDSTSEGICGINMEPSYPTA